MSSNLRREATAAVDPASHAAARHDDVNPTIVVLIASIATFTALLDLTVVNVALPDLERSFPDATFATLSWVATAYAVPFAAFLTPAGRLADVVGRRQLFLSALGAFILASGLCVLAPNVTTLLAGRALQGCASAAMIPAALGLLMGTLPPERRVAGIGAWTAAGSMAAVAGPVVGGLLIEVWSWRAVFVINIPIGIVGIAATLRYFRRDAGTGGRLPDPAGSLAAAIGIGAGVLGLSQGSEWGWGSARVVACLGAGVVLVVLCLLRSRRHPAPAVEMSLWQLRPFSVANASAFLVGMAMYAWMLSGPLFLSHFWEYSSLKAGLAITPGAIASAVVSIGVSRRASPAQLRAAAVVGAAIVSLDCAIMALVVSETAQYLAVWLPVGVLGGVGVGAALTGLGSIAVTSVGPQRFAAGTGLSLTARQVGGAIGIALLAVQLSGDGLRSVSAFHRVWWTSAIAALLASSVALMLRSSSPAPDAASTQRDR